MRKTANTIISFFVLAISISVGAFGQSPNIPPVSSFGSVQDTNAPRAEAISVQQQVKYLEQKELGAKEIAASIADNFLVFGHAGSPLKYPENTIDGFRQAVLEGANAIEVDLSFTKDYVVVLWHDWDFNGIAEIGRQLGLEGYKYAPYVSPFARNMGLVSELTFSQVSTECGYGKIGTSYNGIIPKFDDLARWLSSESRVKLVFMDIKIPKNIASETAFMMDKIYESASHYGVLDRLVFFSPYQNIVKAALLHSQAKGYGMKIGLDMDVPPVFVFGISPKDTVIRYAKAFESKNFPVVENACKLGLSYAAVGRPISSLVYGSWPIYQRIIRYNLEAAKKCPGLQLFAWTINDPQEEHWLVCRGVNGIITNEVSGLRSLVGK